MSLKILISLFIVYLPPLISPGPDFIIVTKHALNNYKKGVLCSLGIASGVLFHSLYIVLGLGALIIKYKLLFIILKYLGASYLIYIGLNLLGVDVLAKLSKKNKDSKVKITQNAFKTGLLTNLLNPKAIIFLISIYQMFINNFNTFSLKIIYILFMVLPCFIWFSLVSFLLSNTFIQAKFVNFMAYLDKIFGIIIISISIYIICS